MSINGPSTWLFNMNGMVGQLHLNAWNPQSTTGTLSLGNGAENQYTVVLSVNGTNRIAMVASPQLNGAPFNFTGLLGGDTGNEQAIMAGSFASDANPSEQHPWFAQLQGTSTGHIQPGTSYTIKAGDSLWSIAQQAYGNGADWQKIYDANKQAIGNDPRVIHPGTVVHIP